MIRGIDGALYCDNRAPKTGWIAIPNKKKHKAGDDRFLPPGVKVTYTHTVKVNGVAVALQNEVFVHIMDIFPLLL